jgi:hypothetical protein
MQRKEVSERSRRMRLALGAVRLRDFVDATLHVVAQRVLAPYPRQARQRTP